MPECLIELQGAKLYLASIVGDGLPSWQDIIDGIEAPKLEMGNDPGEWHRGWQFYVCSFSENLFKNDVIWPLCDRSQRTLLLSQSGGLASMWLRAIPSELGFIISPLRMQVAIRRRLRWPLPLSGGRCSKRCRYDNDTYGDHAASCMRSGKVQRRGRILEKNMA